MLRELALLLIVTVTGACPRGRRTHYLLPTTSNGFGNQYYAIEKALWLALATNRTLILPPVLDHAGPRAFAAWPGCGDAKRLGADAVLRAYRRVAAGASRGWRDVLDFSEVEAAGVRVVDFAEWAPEDVSDLTGLCGGAAVGALTAATADVVVTGSPLRMELEPLRRRSLQGSRCGWRLISAAYAPPFVSLVADAAAAEAATRGPYVAVQLRTGDRSSIDTDARAAHLVTTLSPRLAHGLPIYVAYDLETSFEAFSTFLDVSCPKCGHTFSRRDLRYDGIVRALGRELADVAFDMAFAAHATELFLTDDAPHAFRKRSTFGRLLKRYHMRHGAADVTHYV